MEKKLKTIMIAITLQIRKAVRHCLGGSAQMYLEATNLVLWFPSAVQKHVQELYVLPPTGLLVILTSCTLLSERFLALHYPLLDNWLRKMGGQINAGFATILISCISFQWNFRVNYPGATNLWGFPRGKFH